MWGKWRKYEQKMQTNMSPKYSHRQLFFHILNVSSQNAVELMPKQSTEKWGLSRLLLFFIPRSNALIWFDCSRVMRHFKKFPKVALNSHNKSALRNILSQNPDIFLCFNYQIDVN